MGLVISKIWWLHCINDYAYFCFRTYYQVCLPVEKEEEKKTGQQEQQEKQKQQQEQQEKQKQQQEILT